MRRAAVALGLALAGCDQISTAAYEAQLASDPTNGFTVTLGQPRRRPLNTIDMPFTVRNGSSKFANTVIVECAVRAGNTLLDTWQAAASNIAPGASASGKFMVETTPEIEQGSPTCRVSQVG